MSSNGSSYGKSNSKPIDRCQVCGNTSLQSVIFLGYFPPVSTMPKVGEVAAEEPAYPLELLRCPECAMAQIGLEVDPKVLFHQDYTYRTRHTRILRDNFAELCREASALLKMSPNDLVVDIGSNDGTLLSNFQGAGFQVLGIEPTQAAHDATERGIRTVNRFFNKKTAEDARREFGEAKLVTSANCFAHMSDIHGVMEGILALLGKNGVFVSENGYLLDLVETVQYDTIYHEHLRNYSVGNLVRLFDMHGMEIFHAKRIPTHGGSIRVYAARKGEHKVQPSVAELINIEKRAGLHDGSGLESFSKRVLQTKLDFFSLVADIKRKNQKIYALGVPSRTITLVNYVGIDNGLVDCALEIKGSYKIGRYISGTRIPIFEESKLYEDQPDYLLILSWHIAEELADKVRKSGFKGKFIVPLPEPRIFS